jgi:hypothetical protein
MREEPGTLKLSHEAGTNPNASLDDGNVFRTASLEVLLQASRRACVEDSFVEREVEDARPRPGSAQGVTGALR